MLKLFVFSIILVGSLQASSSDIDGLSKVIQVFNSVIGVLTNGFLQVALTVALIGSGFMYILGKEQMGKDQMQAVFKGAAIILTASGIAELFVG
jgi:hypothetical protein